MIKKSNYERRKGTRFSVKSDVILHKNESESKGILKNLSVNGAFIKTNSHFKPFEKIHLLISVNRNGKQLSADIDAEVSRCDNNGIGIQFRNMDMKTFSTIKNMSEAFSREPEKIEKELENIFKTNF